jgi:hypothetical protein
LCWSDPFTPFTASPWRSLDVAATKAVAVEMFSNFETLDIKALIP